MPTTDYGQTNNPAIRQALFAENDRKALPVRWTAFLEYGPDGDIEEVDFDAAAGQDAEAVRSAAEFIAERDYETGVTHIRVEQRFGLYL